MVSYEQNIVKEKYGLVKYYGLDSARATLNAGLETGSKYIATDTGLTYIFQAYYKSKTNKTIVVEVYPIRVLPADCRLYKALRI